VGNPNPPIPSSLDHGGVEGWDEGRAGTLVAMPILSKFGAILEFSSTHLGLK